MQPPYNAWLHLSVSPGISLPMPQNAPSNARWIVLKFGGTSVSKRERWDTIGRLAAERAQLHQARALVVVSALAGVTNALQEIVDGAAEAQPGFERLAQLHRDFAAELGLDADQVLAGRLATLQALATDARAADRTLDWQAEVLAQGELLSSTLGAAYLRTQGLDCGWLDARDWLQAQRLPNQTEWTARMAATGRREAGDEWRRSFAAQSDAPLLLTQGFIARHEDGGTALFGRSGSDTSAALFGGRLRAERVEIWTDVPGMFSANPREVPDARLLQRLDYAEAQEITTTGARVLHPRALGPCREAGVPLAILDTARPDLPGTVIDDGAGSVPGVKAISRRGGIVLVSMETVGMWQQVGFLADVFDIFREHGLSVDLLGSSETNVTVSLDSSENLVSTDVLSRLSEDLAKCCRVKVIAPCASMTLVGGGMRSLLHKLSVIWATFGQERVHLISQSSNDLNLTFVIDEADAEGMLATLHAQLIASGAMPAHEQGVFGPRWNELSGTARVRGTPWWHAERERLLELAAEGTPAYVHHLPTVRARARALAAMEPVDRRFYAIKANPHPEILNALAEEGFGLECVSLAELRHARASVPGLEAGRLLFTPSFAPIDEYAAAFELGAIVTLDNVEALRRWPDVFRGRKLWLRVDLGRGEGHHAKVKTGGVASKFGLPVGRIEEFTQAARQLDIRIDGLHAHLGSGVDTPEHWRSVCDELGGIANRIGSIDTIDIGGGLPIPYRAEDEPFDLDAWSAGIAEVKAAYPGYRIAIEPGRYLVAECGVLLLTTTQVVEKHGVRRVGGDAGMNALMRPALYEAWHDIHNLSRLDDTDVVDFDVVGPICETGDVLGTGRPLPAATAPGDVLLVADTGAYGMVMSNTYNLRELPRVEIIK